jgi:hypothetical protein
VVVVPGHRRGDAGDAAADARAGRGGEVLPAQGPLPMPVYANPGAGEGPLGREDAENFHP